MFSLLFGHLLACQGPWLSERLNLGSVGGGANKELGAMLLCSKNGLLGRSAWWFVANPASAVGFV